jgi:acetyl-CoA synthetase (ADP-forming)
MIGLTRDEQFGPCVAFGLGGIFTEILRDVSFRVAPFNREDALEMMREIRGRRILEAVRGLPEADTEQLAEILVRLGSLGLENDRIREVDCNPVILQGADPVVVDASIILQE